jgi:hypothetical protein
LCVRKIDNEKILILSAFVAGSAGLQASIARINPWFKEFPDKLATGFPIFNWPF